MVGLRELEIGLINKRERKWRERMRMGRVRLQHVWSPENLF